MSNFPVDGIFVLRGVSMALLLSKNDLQAVLTMPEVIATVRQTYISYSQGKADSPIRTPLEVPGEGVGLVMPGYVPDCKVFGAKIVSVFEKNSQRQLPTVTSIVALNEAETGRPLAIIEGGFLTAMRTGAGSGVATQLLARKDAGKLAVIGCGGQAATQIEAVVTVRTIREIRLFDANQANAQALADKIQASYPAIAVRVATDARDAVVGSDILVTVTTSRQPVFSAEWITPGMHINAIGAFKPTMQELPEELLHKADKIVVDTWEGVIEEAGDFIIPLQAGTFKEDGIYGEIGLVASGDKQGRVSDQEITLYKSVGVAALDIAVGALAYQKAREKGWGTEFNFTNQ